MHLSHARSLFPKRYDLLGYLSASSADIVSVTETFFDNTILSSQVCPPQYTPFRRDCDRHGGGLLILIKSSIPAVRRTDLEGHCEVIWIQIETRDAWSYIVWCILSSTKFRCYNFRRNYNAAISSIPGNSPIVLCGDFNVPNIDWSFVAATVSSPISSTFQLYSGS